MGRTRIGRAERKEQVITGTNGNGDVRSLVRKRVRALVDAEVRAALDAILAGAK